MWSRIVARHCVTCVGCTPYSLANCETVLSPTRASNPTLALKAALCRLRFAFIVCFLFSSRPAKVHLNLWSSFWGPPQVVGYPVFSRSASNRLAKHYEGFDSVLSIVVVPRNPIMVEKDEQPLSLPLEAIPMLGCHITLVGLFRQLSVKTSNRDLVSF